MSSAEKSREISLRTETYLKLCQQFIVEVFRENSSSIELRVSELRDWHILTFFVFFDIPKFQRK